MWTIRYEFRCYLVVALLGVVGLLDRRGQVLGLTILCYLIAAALNFSGGLSMRAGLLHQFVFGVIGDPALLVPLLAIFLSGVCAFLYRDRISFRGAALALSAVVSLVAILALPFPEAAIGTAGCYFLLWVGLGLKSKFLEKINNDYDFSYGVYLYAWPIAALIMLASQRAHLNLLPGALTGLTAVLSTVAGAISWYGLERPALKRKSKRPRMKRIAIA
jgi:peptidoglycan/LPS O-acetylase OafA/YrhL